MDNTILPFDGSHAHSWYKKWREKIRRWLERNADSDWADILLLLPDLFMFAVGVMSDSRIPYKFRLALLSAVLYVLSPFDLIPEAILGVAGLTDDAGILILLLDLLFNALNLEPDVLAQVIEDRWHGEEDLVSTIRTLLTKLKKMPGNLIIKLRSLIERWWPTRRDKGAEMGSSE
ncbi:MAG: YkvA family protein [Chloroflexi bacterium]|nr:YkvA family protein [Chloroflexota bacterium]